MGKCFVFYANINTHPALMRLAMTWITLSQDIIMIMGPFSTTCEPIPVNMLNIKQLHNICTMLDQRRRRCTNVIQCNVLCLLGCVSALVMFSIKKMYMCAVISFGIHVCKLLKHVLISTFLISHWDTVSIN